MCFVWPALDAVKTHYAPLSALGSRTVRAFVWQPNLLMVVWYIYDCFQVRAQIMTMCRCSIESASSGWTDVILIYPMPRLNVKP